VLATARCLTGCAVGEVSALVAFVLTVPVTDG
jgi:hypothetical protein